ncbi:hypothetical protein P7K49_015893 [Saguinus oedipus]|uniref:Uncharacterized protein n=1 Tax=Saguinus oedipus TaxID=9490 RepID=A0ABQ9VAH8_SAGOE|nr:hypothetical protein P7K49_015893 [Saguinus oedipus]
MPLLLAALAPCRLIGWSTQEGTGGAGWRPAPSPLGRTLSGAAGGRADGLKMAQTQGTRRKVCYYYDGEHRPRGGGGAGAGAGPGRTLDLEAEAGAEALGRGSERRLRGGKKKIEAETKRGSHGGSLR